MTRLVTIVDETRTAKPAARFLSDVSASLTAQVSEFCAEWSIAEDVIIGVGTDGSMLVHLVDDDAQVSGALGYHTVDPTGAPEAWIFVKTILDHGGTWVDGPNSVSVCMSHELLEMLLDLEANEFVFDGAGRMWAREACDAVETGTYPVLGCAVSSYVLPAYFSRGAAGPYDKLHRLAAPFSVDRGGYSIVSKAGPPSRVFGAAQFVPDPNGELALVVGDRFPAWKHAIKAAPVSRTMRRLAAGASMLLSTS
jgi:hypothetical protein